MKRVECDGMVPLHLLPNIGGVLGVRHVPRRPHEHDRKVFGAGLHGLFCILCDSEGNAEPVLPMSEGRFVALDEVTQQKY